MIEWSSPLCDYDGRSRIRIVFIHMEIDNRELS